METRGFLRLFGRPQLEWEGRVWPLAFERRNQLVAYLALRRTWVGRAELAELLWPDQPSRLSHANLRKTIFRLQSLPWGGQVQAQANALRFLVPTDVQALDSGDAVDPAAVAGDLLEGYEEGGEGWSQWLAFERERTRALRRGAVLAALDGVDPAQACELTASLLAGDPTDEALLVAHMNALARAGQAARARAAYREFELRLADEFGLLPGALAKSTYDALGNAQPVEPPAPRPAGPRTGADPGFVGRATELRQLHAWLAAGQGRVASIIGPGGAGKTRLAASALRELAADFPDGAQLVRFEDLGPGSDIATPIAAALAIPMPGPGQPLAQLAKALGSRRLLLVLDNLEHLGEVRQPLEELLQQCTGLHLLLTSRVRVPLADGITIALEGLPCPDPEDTDRLEAFDAVQLFTAAARRVEPAFNPTIEAAWVVDICRQVDGLPLALEIAAAWTRVLSCASIAAELRHGGELLHSEDPARPARHASMEVVFAQSWNLLTPVERESLARLSVFRGGFTPVAAKTVASAPLPVLGALADKSLLRKEGDRLHIHPLLHQLAAARLADGEPLRQAEEAHARYFHRFMAQLQGSTAGAHRNVLAPLEAELENCRKAWSWAVRHGEGDLLVRSVAPLRDFFDHRGRCVEGLQLVREALADGSALPAAARARILSIASHLQYRLDRYADAIADATRAAQEAGAGGDRDTLQQCFTVLGASHLRLGKYDQARHFFTESLRVAPDSTNPRVGATSMDNLALIEKYEGRFDEALKMGLAALAKFRELGDVAAEALCLNNIGTLEGELGRTAISIEHLKASLAVCERHGLATTRAFALANLAEQSVAAGDLAGARRHAADALESARATGARVVEAAVHLHLSAAALAEGDDPQACASLKAALEIAQALQLPVLLASGAMQFADIVQARGLADAAAILRQWTLGRGPLTRHQERKIAHKLQGSAPRVPATLASLSLADLAARIAIETGVGYAGLLAELAAPA